MVTLAKELAEPFMIAGQVGLKVMLDLTLYPTGPTEPELEGLIDAYEKLCPADRRKKYKIAENEFWSEVARPDLTASGRAAAAAGTKRPWLEPVRRRIRDGRGFEIQFWDDRPIQDPEGSWSFNCRAVHLEKSGLHSFLRILFPLSTDAKVLHSAAGAFADAVDLHSGHGGLTFVYDPWYKEAVFDAIYAQSRRFWGVDIEELNGTVPLMKKGIKGVNWITVVGQAFAARPDVKDALAKLAKAPQVSIEPRKQATLLVAGPEPAIGDQHRPDHSLDPCYAVADALKPLFLDAHPDFPGVPFIENGNTIGWIRRFLDPAGWR